MSDFPGSTDWIKEIIPDIEGRVAPFIVDTGEVDDELIEVFIEELRRLTDELLEGLESLNGEMIRGAAHSIKGMGGTIGLPEISVLGLHIEDLARDQHLDDTRASIEALAAWMTSFSREPTE